MDAQELLRQTEAMSPAGLVAFARVKVDNMDGLELYALVLALTTKLEKMIDDEAASINLDFRKIANQAEFTRHLDTFLGDPEQAAIEQTADLVEIHRKLDTFLGDPEPAEYPVADFIKPSNAIAEAVKLEAQHAIENSELAERAAGFEVP